MSTRELDQAAPLRRLVSLVAGRGTEFDRERPGYAVVFVLLVALYFGAARLGIELSVAHGVITPVWAPTGIALAALMLFGRRLWPAVALGALIANATSGASVPEAAGISVGNTLEAVVGATLLLRVGFRPRLDRVRDVFALVLLGAVASTTIAATNGVTTLWISGDVSGSSYGSEWLLWWIGDGMGDLVVAPLLLVWAATPLRSLTRARTLEALALLGLLVAVCSFVFLAGYWRYPHVLFPLLIWAALRFRQPGAVTTSFVVAAIAIGGAVSGTAPLGNGSTTEIVQILEGLLAAVSVSLLILGAVLEERGAAKEQLGRAHAGLAEAQAVAHIGSWEWDILMNRVTWSDELHRLYGLEPEPGEMSYESYLDRVHPDDREMIRQTVERAYAEGTPFAFNHRILLQDGQVRWFHGRGRVVRDGSGTAVRMVGTSQDITERKRLDELRDNILSTVSHELRTPLTTIIGSAATLKERSMQLTGETYATIVANLGEQARRLELLLADLLDVDRLRLGLIHPTFRATDVGELVARVAAEHAQDSRRIELQVEPAVAEIDAPKVERIVENLLVNALKHTPTDSTICVRTETLQEGVLISVNDRGPGIPEQDREAVFELFKRGETSSQVPGTGIGLSLVARFAELHGGRAWVEENRGGGASFRVLLPAQRPRQGAS